MSGIYVTTNTLNGKMHIGSAKSFNIVLKKQWFLGPRGILQ